MNTIRILPEKVATQIAAGEIIERPASVVRELIDNSIDAGADRITIRIENGGKKLIKIVDNGEGMSRDDLLLCVERHATSKIREASDLLQVKSLGFRGEALPSMASISRMSITSVPRGELTGNKLRISGGKLLTIEEAGAPSGTITEVQDLFFNVPGRRKFLRSPQTEKNHITNLFLRTSLPFPNIHFRLEDGPRTALNLPASDDPRLRLSAIMGKEASRAILESTVKKDSFTIRIFAAPSDFARSRSDRLFCYINGRNIRDRTIVKAIMEGYGQRLMKGRFPQVVVFIDMDPSLVDMNVHPTKQEVKFRNPQDIFQAVSSGIGKMLSPGLQFSASSPRTVPEHEPVYRLQTPLASVSEGKWTYTGEVPAPHPETTPPAEKYSVEKELQVIGQLGGTYILCQSNDGLLLIDQHAAHERIVYENLKKAFETATVETQALLIPFEIELSVRERTVALEKGDDLNQFGLEIDHFGGNTFLLRAVPALLRDVDWAAMVSELLSRIEGNNADFTSFMDDAVTVMACHGAIRAGQNMNVEEMRLLIDQLRKMDIPTNCPHGRPIIKQFSYYEIEKMFKRVV
jgi:DNA mismatch repair protein MutL